MPGRNEASAEDTDGQRRLLLVQAADVHHNPPGFSGPGVVAKLGGPGLTKVIHALIIPPLEKLVNAIVIPEMSCYEESCEKGGLQYDVQPIKIENFHIGFSKVKGGGGGRVGWKRGGSVGRDRRMMELVEVYSVVVCGECAPCTSVQL